MGLYHLKTGHPKWHPQSAVGVLGLWGGGDRGWELREPSHTQGSSVGKQGTGHGGSGMGRYGPAGLRFLCAGSSTKGWRRFEIAIAKTGETSGLGKSSGLWRLC